MNTSLFQGLSDKINSCYIDPLLQRLKFQTATLYLKGIRGTHRILMLVCLLIFVITLIGASLVMIPLALLLFMPWDPATKAIIGVSVGAVYLLIPAVSLITLLSERRWMRITGAASVVNKIVS